MYACIPNYIYVCKLTQYTIIPPSHTPLPHKNIEATINNSKERKQ